MSLSSFFSSLLPVIHADAPDEVEVKNQESQQEEKGEEETAEEGAEEEEEPEDIMPKIQEDCMKTSKCAPAAAHFAHCEEKVRAGQGFPGEDCVEEFMMHCVDACTAPQLFAKLK